MYLIYDPLTGESKEMEEDFAVLWYGEKWQNVLDALEPDAFGIVSKVNGLEIIREK